MVVFPVKNIQSTEEEKGEEVTCSQESGQDCHRNSLLGIRSQGSSFSLFSTHSSRAHTSL
jgi:hypothetical protein